MLHENIVQLISFGGTIKKLRNVKSVTVTKEMSVMFHGDETLELCLLRISSRPAIVNLARLKVMPPIRHEVRPTK